jgi:hypothetical protein
MNVLDLCCPIPINMIDMISSVIMSLNVVIDLGFMFLAVYIQSYIHISSAVFSKEGFG